MAPDWGSSFAAVWNLDEQSDGTASVTRHKSAGTCAGTDCDLTDVSNASGSFTASDSLNKQQGQRSAAPVNQRSLECMSTVCSEIVPVSGESVTAGCWARHTATTYGPLAWAYSGLNGGWYLDTDNGAVNHDSIAFGVGTNGLNVVRATSSAGALPLDTWTHVVGRFDNAADEAQVLINGAISGMSATPPGFGATPPGRFRLSANVEGYNWDGQVDECFIIKTQLSDTEICRICSCGIDGSLCFCNGAAYATPDSFGKGRNVAECGGCALPTCDAAPPPTPTATGTPTPTESPTPSPTPT